MTSLNLGVVIGWMSPAAPALQSETPPLGGSLPLSDDTISWLGSLNFLGGIVGVFFWGQITEKLGRKAAGYMIALPLIIGWSAVIFSDSDFWILTGRFIMGLSATGALILTPSFVSDIAEDYYKGTLGSFVILFFNFGVVLAYFFGAVLSVRNLTLVCLLLPILFLFFYYFLPESPVYLWTKGKRHEARVSLMWYRSGNRVAVEKELSVLDAVVSSSKSIPFSRLYESRGAAKAITNSLALFTFQQFSGILMLLSYTSIILQHSGIDYSPHKATVVIGSVQLIASWATSFFVDRINRRTAILCSNFGMSIALFVIGWFFYLQKTSDANYLPNWVPFVALNVHMVFYSVAGAMGYIITSETIKPDVLPLAFSVSIFWGTVMSFASVKIYVILVDHLNLYGNFWFFSVWCIIAIVYTVIFIPETKGKSILENLKVLNGEKVTIGERESLYQGCKYQIPLGNQKT